MTKEEAAREFVMRAAALERTLARATQAFSLAHPDITMPDITDEELVKIAVDLAAGNEAVSEAHEAFEEALAREAATSA